MLSSRVSADWRRIWRTRVSRGMDGTAVSARFPRDVTGSPASALGTGCSPGNPLCAGAESPKPAPQRASGSPVQPCGLVCEVMACRIGHTGPATPAPRAVELHPGTRGTAELRFACSFSSGSAAVAVLDLLSPAESGSVSNSHMTSPPPAERVLLRVAPPSSAFAAPYGAHRRHFRALHIHAVLAHVVRGFLDRSAERHPHLDPLRAVVPRRRRHEPRLQRPSLVARTL